MILGMVNDCFTHITHMLHVWNIYQHLPPKSPSHFLVNINIPCMERMTYINFHLCKSNPNMFPMFPMVNPNGNTSGSPDVTRHPCALWHCLKQKERVTESNCTQRPGAWWIQYDTVYIYRFMVAIKYLIIDWSLPRFTVVCIYIYMYIYIYV